MPSDAWADSLSDLPRLKRAARRALAEAGPRGLTDQVLARTVTAAKRLDSALARALAHSLLGDDDRYTRGEDGRWRAVGGRGTRPIEEGVFTVVDVETTGTGSHHRIIEIGAVRVEGLHTAGTYETLIDAGVEVPPDISALTGITQDMVDSAPGPAEALEGLLAFLGDSIFCAHNAPFDRGFVFREARVFLGVEMENAVLCTRLLARRARPDLGGYSLDRVARQMGYVIEARHRGLGDALAAAHVLVASCQELRRRGVQTVEELLYVQKKANYDRFMKERE